MLLVKIMGWFEKSPEAKAEECEDCAKTLKSGKKYKVCECCGHLYTGKACSCGCAERACKLTDKVLLNKRGEKTIKHPTTPQEVIIKDKEGKPIFKITEVGDVSLTEYEVNQITEIMQSEEPSFTIWSITFGSIKDDLMNAYDEESVESLWKQIKDKEAFAKQYVETFADLLAKLDINEEVVIPALQETFKKFGIDASFE